MLTSFPRIQHHLLWATFCASGCVGSPSLEIRYVSLSLSLTHTYTHAGRGTRLRRPRNRVGCGAAGVPSPPRAIRKQSPVAATAAVSWLAAGGRGERQWRCRGFPQRRRRRRRRTVRVSAVLLGGPRRAAEVAGGLLGHVPGVCCLLSVSPCRLRVCVLCVCVLCARAGCFCGRVFASACCVFLGRITGGEERKRKGKGDGV